jgi:hypothetical protein
MRMTSRFFLLLILLGFASAVYAEEPKGDKQKGLTKTTKDDVTDYISINSVLMWIGNNGMTAHNPLTDASGLEWPKGSGKYAIFTDGLIWGGTVQGDTRVGGATYRYGLQAGPINASGQAEDPSDTRYKIYKVRKADSLTYYTKMTEDEKKRLKDDFEAWPTRDGAPWKDRNNNGVYDPNFADWLVKGDLTTSDTPWFIGDEVLWFVSNDMNGTRCSNLYGTGSIGLELQTLVWGYDQTGPLGNMVFTKYTLINKGTNDLENAYLSKWSDPDLGDANDDFVAVDTALTLGYVYNALAKDGVYGIPPAAGYDFFQGPIVPGDPTDTARYNFGKRAGFRNLGVTSFVFYINSDGQYIDPELGKPAGSTEMYNYMRSRLYNGSPFIDPNTGLQVPICLAGDPIKKTGWIDGQVRGPGDRRFLMTAGPFTLAQKDEQEIVVATIVGRGSDRISSLQVLKYFDRYAQIAFDQNFDLPKAPPQPVVHKATLDKKIILSWGDKEQVKTIENFDDRSYKFQGYNIYQFPGKSSTMSEAKRIATFDKVDLLATIFDDVIDDRSGAIVSMPVQLGSDEGLKHSIVITNDALLDRPLVNNQPYYFAVTTYSYTEDSTLVPRQLESTPKIFEVRPQAPNPGYRYTAKGEELLTINHTSGFSTGEVLVEVCDPMALKDATYEVSFTATGKVKVFYDPDTLEFDNYGAWSLLNITENKKEIDNYTIFNAFEGDYYVIDGFRIGLKGSGHYDPEKEIQKLKWGPGQEVYTKVPEWAWQFAYHWGWGTTIEGYDVKTSVEIRFDTTKGKGSKGYMYLRGGVPNYAYTGYYESPMTVWDITAKPERQLSWIFVEQKGSAANDHVWAPTTSNGDREYMFILDHTYSDTPDTTYASPYWSFNSYAANLPLLYVSWYVQNQNYGKKFPWRSGDKWTIVPNVPFSDQDKYTFTTMKAKYTDVTARTDIEKINVFPNPYYGTNGQELNKYQRFVTFNHLPPHAQFRVYTVSGTLIASFEKNDQTQLATWNLLNDQNLPVGSGMYIIHIDMPELGVEKILKLGVVGEQQFLDRI